MVKDINSFYFTEDDYEVFSEENATKGTQAIRDKRIYVQDKLKDINNELYPLILNNNLGLATHKSPEHLTSLAFPCKWNKYRVDWLGIRYGRNARDIQELEEILSTNRTAEDKKYGFQKYACLQVNICYSGVEVGIFHSVPYDAIDRAYMKDNIDKEELQEAIIDEIRKLKGYGYVWSISDNIETYNFNFDTERAEDFINFYKKYDKEGCWSSMLRHFPRFDERITEENIITTCYDIIEQLKPLYELIIWKRGN